jgi:hypothetical protein
VAVALCLILAKDYFWILSGLRLEWIGIALLFAAFAYIGFAKGNPVRLQAAHLIVAILVLTSWIGSSIVVSTPNGSSYYAAFVIASLISGIRPAHLNKTLTAIVACNAVVQLIEFLADQFLFAYIDDENLYDEETLAVGDGTLRAKGFFASPLNAISVTMSVAFLNPRSPINWFLVTVTSILGQGRLGLGVGSIGLILCLAAGMKGAGRHRKMAFLYFVGAIAMLFVWATYLASEDALQRMLEATSADNSQNLSRLYFWGRAMEELLDYPSINLLFGRPGYIKALEGGTESDWLRIWLDNGLLCVLGFLVPLLMTMIRSIANRQPMGIYAAIACLFVMAVFPHAQSMPNGTLTWLFLFGAVSGVSSIVAEKRIRTRGVAPGY